MDISGILSQVRVGGFINPLAEPITSAFSGIVIPDVSALTALATVQANAQGVPVPSSGSIIAAQTSMTNVINSSNNLLGHTNRISGVDLTGNGTLATIAKTMQSAKTINGETSCATILGAFGAITNAANLITESIEAANKIKQLLLDIPGMINSIPAALDTYINKVANQVASDLQILAQGQLDVLQANISQVMVSLFDDECTGAILGAVMTQPMRDEVDKVATKVSQSKIKSITGKIF